MELTWRRDEAGAIAGSTYALPDYRRPMQSRLTGRALGGAYSSACVAAYLEPGCAPEALRALAHLLALAPALHPGAGVYLARALAGCGCATIRDGDSWSYRPPGEDGWLPLPLPPHPRRPGRLGRLRGWVRRPRGPA